MIIGFNENIDPTIIEAHNITNYTPHQLVNAISAGSRLEDGCRMKKNPKIRYIEDDIYVHTTKKAQLQPQQIDWGV